ncbi:MAG: diacylglycerol kinase family lipid kinase [Bacteroidales bacterium]|nr:diacylglycerol kinase family lipid kinase [Bacteroidales bacterium]HPD95516.1 diacylglycerol kinase family lipid kinase [Tenuifilaceae bacterium]
MKNWFVIVNPRAGGGKGKSDWPLIERLLTEHDIAFTHVFTAHKHHAVELAVNAITSGYTKLISVGGDGTLNEVVNGIFLQNVVSPSEITVGVIGVGTGNDWFRMYEIPHSYEACIKAIKSKNVFHQDVGIVEYYESSILHKRYFVNAAGVGFDAEVAFRTNRLKDLGRKGMLLYIISLIKALIRYKSTRMNVNVNGYHFQDKTFSLTVGICKYNGAGMMQVPFAISDDGLFDITMIKKISKINVLASVTRLYNGTILKHSKVTGIRGNSIEIMSIPGVNLEADGESLGETPLKFTILHKALAVIVADSYVCNNSIEEANKHLIKVV